jgi:hypothetical protein
MWRARSPAQKRAAGTDLERIFARQAPGLYDDGTSNPEDSARAILSGSHPPGVSFHIDFTCGQVKIAPQTLLDHLADGLLRFRSDLAVCERKDCRQLYYLRSHGRQRFCSHSCAKQTRAEKKAQWWAENRERHIKKWRKQRKQRKQARQNKHARRRLRSRTP